MNFSELGAEAEGRARRDAGSGAFANPARTQSKKRLTSKLLSDVLDVVLNLGLLGDTLVRGRLRLGEPVPAVRVGGRVDELENLGRRVGRLALPGQAQEGDGESGHVEGRDVGAGQESPDGDTLLLADPEE